MLSNLFFIIIVQITFFSFCCIKAFEFNLRFINVDYHSARFEIVDDNITTLNYVVSYDLNSIKQQEIDPKIIETVSATRTFRIQTNSDRLAQLQLNSTRLNLTDPISINNDESGENYNSEELRQIKHESWTDMHQFVIDTLDENRVYDVTFRITAKQAHLKIFNNKRKIDTNTTTSQSISKQFRFNFKTTFNLEVAAKKACDQFKLNKMNKSINSMFAQCYQTDSECTKCNSNCYEIKSSDIINSNKINLKPVLCEPCPCDTLRSTGSCDYNLTEDTVTCKQCIKPYTGSLCSLCENDGVDFYRNEIGKCISCECNGNTWFENTDILIKNGNRRRKCQAITGNCIDCMFNTTGKHCDQCKSGYHGDPLKRTCVLKPTNLIKTQPTPDINHLTNNKHSSKSLALFSLYIFAILFLVIIVYLFIRYKYLQDAALKNGPYHPLGCCLSCNSLFQPITGQLERLSESMKRARIRSSIYIESVLPNSINKLRGNTNTSTNGNAMNEDDDRLNLAEYQIFDESLYANDENGKSYTFRPHKPIVNDPFSDNDDNVIINGKNPYCSLTIKS